MSDAVRHMHESMTLLARRLATVEAERDRLADENARANGLLWYASAWLYDHRDERAQKLASDIDALLASAGPPQEAKRGSRAAEIDHALRYDERSTVRIPPDPPPERRCTWTGYSSSASECYDPACPEHGHGTAQDPAGPYE